MNVMFNTYPVAFDTPGGGEIQLLKTREYLQLLGHKVDLYNQWIPNYKDIDIVHFFSVFGGSQVYCDAVKNKNLPLAISSVLYPHKNFNQYPMDEISRLLRSSDIILPNSQIEANLLSEVFDIDIEKFYIVYNGVDDIFINNEDDDDGSLFREHFGIDFDFLLNVANIEPRKNQLTLSRALANTDYMLIILGHIRDQCYYEEIIRSSKGRVKYLGYIPNESPLLRSAYKACQLFVLPSLLETPGLAALEAAASGAKIAVTEVGSTREYFLNFAQYFNPEDEDGFLNVIESSIDADYTQDLMAHICNNFTWKNTGLQTLQAYQKILL